MRPTTITIAALLMLTAGLAALAPASTAASHGDSALPSTVYEDPAIPPQAMDYDADTKTFPTHAGWIDDKLIHYYKFQMYTPGSYGTDQFGPNADNQVPIVPLYLVTTVDSPTSAVNPFTGIPEGQHPIIEEFPTKDNQAYSDFVRVNWVVVDSEYEANDYDSAEDVESHSGPVVESSIVANVPIVPVGSSLAHPTQDGDAPIDGLTVWYEGLEAQAFVFETTDADFAAYFNDQTRTGNAGDEGSGFEVVTTDEFVTTTGEIASVPIWHVNQYWTGVTPGQNNGGPSANGQRNTIDVDRTDPGYSPLWQVFWLTQLPPGYEVDQASNADQFSKSNGFEIFASPMFVNCPNIGPHGGSSTNQDKAPGFTSEPTLESGESITLEGALVMPGAPTEVTLKTDGEQIATTQSNPMGGFLFEVDYDDLTGEENTLTAVGPDGETVATWTVHGAGDVGHGGDGAMDGDDGNDGETDPAPLPGAVFVLIAIAAAGLIALRARR